MSRGCALGLRLIIAALLIIAVVWGSLWAYVEYAAHRARVMLAEASRIQVGDTEASILPLVRRYGGVKWTPDSLPPREQWIDKEEYDYQQNRVSDYKYVFGLSPFGAIVDPNTRLTQAMEKVRAAVPARLRAVLGMRDWGAKVQLSIRGGRVRSVSAMTVFAGRSRWLGHSWELSEGMPRHQMRQRAYAIGAAHMTMAEGGGTMIDNFITPKASEKEVETARQFNSGCLTSIKGCAGLCDVAPRALEYLKQHPDTRWNIIPPECP